MSWLGSLAVSGSVAAAAGWLVFRLWAPLGLPATGVGFDAPFPGVWRGFFAVCLPALFPATTAVHALVCRRGEKGPGSRALWWDRASHVLLPAFLLLMLGWKTIGAWRLPFAAFFLGVLAAKVLGLVTLLCRRALPPEAEGAKRPLAVPLFLVALLLYAFLTPLVAISVSTVTDEVVYLLNTHSLFADGDVDLRNNLAGRDYRRFYWARAAPAVWNIPFLGFPTLLLPGYALGTVLLPGYAPAGRIGATLTIAVLAALLGMQVYRLCRDLGASRPAAFWTWVVVALTPPLVVNASHVYAEIPAACAAVLGVRAVLRLPDRRWVGLAGAGLAALFMVLLKDRYLPVALGLSIWAVGRLATRRVLPALGLLAGLAAAGVYLLVANPWPGVFPNLGGLAQVRQTLGAWNAFMPLALLGLFADQEFGLFAYGPHWVLAAVGVPLLLRRRRTAAVALLGLVGAYLLVLVKYRWLQWDAGWSPPPRFVLVVAPLLAPFIAEVFDQGRGRLLAAANTVWLAWTAGVAVVLCLVPFWRYNDLDGRSTIVQVAGVALGLDLARFLPSLRAPTAWTWAVLAVGVLAAVAAAVAATRRAPGADPGWGRGAVVLGPAPAAGVVGGLAALWLAAAAVVPTWSIEAEAMTHAGGIPFGSYQFQNILWVMTRDGEISERIVTWPGVTEVTVLAAGYATTGVAPRMTVLLDERPVAAWTLRAGIDGWVRDTYVATFPTRFGHPRLRLVFENLLDHRSARQVQHAYVDRILLRRVGSPPSG